MQFNPRPENKRSPEEGEEKERLGGIKKWLRRAVLLGGLSVATYEAEQNYNPKDYSRYKTFNEAFSHARREGQHNFFWNGGRYTTELMSKEASDLYFESKQFLSDYYRSDYFKNKLTTAADSQALAKEIKIALMPEQNTGVVEEADSDALAAIYGTPEFQEAARVRSESIAAGYDARLRERAYVSLTEERGSGTDDGRYISRPGSDFLYIYQDKRNPEKENTNAVHELTHKSSDETNAMPLELLLLIAKRTGFSLAHHVESEVFFKKYDFPTLAYLENPTEVDARQNAVRFWLYKKYPGYKPDTPFEGKHFDFLTEHYGELPYDIKQQLDMVPNREYFTENMNLF